MPEESERNVKYVFIHGLGQGPESWNAVLEGFDGEGLCPDLFGLAGAERSSYGGLYRAFAAWCRNQGAVCLCGLSLGGVLALHYALERPEQVRALALIGTQFAMPTGMLRLQNAVFRILPEGAFREMGLGKREAIALARSMETLDFRKDLGRISCPALVVCGTRDRANRRAAQELARLLPHGELAWIEGAGHTINTDAPERLQTLLLRFFHDFPPSGRRRDPL